MKKAKKSFAMHDDYHSGEESPAGELPEQAPTRDLSGQMDQVVQGLSGARAAGQVYMVDVRQLEPYPDQPFRQYPPEKLQELADDIARSGILNPILTRQNKNRLQILAGHNRWAAAKLAGLTHVPVLILEANDDQAVLVLTSTNLRQREHLLPSEKAFAYKMQMDALKRQGQKNESGGAYDSSSLITRQTGDSRMQIHRYIRLTGLEPGLLEILDKGRISMTPAVAVSYLSPEAQREVLRCVRDLGAGLTIEKGNALKDRAANGPLSAAEIEAALLNIPRIKRKAETVSIRYDRIKEFLPGGLDGEKLEDWIIEALRSFRG